mgnify:FL=1
MTENLSPAATPLTGDEKIVQLMLYTANAMIWGEVIVKQAIRASTWLRTNAAPDKIVVNNAKVLITTTTKTTQPAGFRELIVPAATVGAYHLLPPASDPLDFDPTEPNRIMVPAVILLGSTKINGKMRMTQQSNLQKYLDVTHELFSSVYDAMITNTLLPSLGTLRIPYLQARQEMCIFGSV